MSKVNATLACNLDKELLSAELPLFAASEVEAIEWSFDTLFNHTQIPDWFVDLLSAFSNEKKLIGHGVFFSLFKAKWSKEQSNWLSHLKKINNYFKFDHVTEHFGLMTGKNFHDGAPLSVPYTSSAVRIAQDRLRRMSDVCQCPVGLENLAFSYSFDDVQRQGAFMDEILSPINGFLILDLHNLYCQTHNFEIRFEEIIHGYNLDMVREIHISGGSWDTSNIDGVSKKIRRDTHDDCVPEEVFEFLTIALTKCPNIKYVVLEQMGFALKTDNQKSEFRDDFLKMKAIVKNHNLKNTKRRSNSFKNNSGPIVELPFEDLLFYEQQLVLSNLLESSTSAVHFIESLKKSSLRSTDWKVENWNSEMLETAYKIAQKWKANP